MAAALSGVDVLRRQTNSVWRVRFACAWCLICLVTSVIKVEGEGGLRYPSMTDPWLYYLPLLAVLIALQQVSLYTFKVSQMCCGCDMWPWKDCKGKSDFAGNEQPCAPQQCKPCTIPFIGIFSLFMLCWTDPYLNIIMGERDDGWLHGIKLPMFVPLIAVTLRVFFFACFLTHCCTPYDAFRGPQMTFGNQFSDLIPQGLAWQSPKNLLTYLPYGSYRLFSWHKFIIDAFQKLIICASCCDPGWDLHNERTVKEQDLKKLIKEGVEKARAVAAGIAAVAPAAAPFAAAANTAVKSGLTATAVTAPKVAAAANIISTAAKTAAGVAAASPQSLQKSHNFALLHAAK